MNREKSGWSIAQLARVIAVLVLLVPAVTSTGFTEERKVVKLPGTAALPFSDGVIAGDTLYIAGQEGVDADGKLVPAGSARRVRRLWLASKVSSTPLVSISRILFPSQYIWPTFTTSPK